MVSATPITKKRYHILALIFVTVVINYMDRSNISVAAAAISEDLNLTKVQLGLIFSAFGLTYSLLQIPGGILADHVRPRLLYPIILVLWSLATLLQGLVSSLAALIGLRASIGVFEAPSYPMNNRIVTGWFPEQERASAIAVYTSGQFIGLAFLTPLLVTVQAYFGWRGLFIFSGIVGLVWAIVWWFLYRDPHDHETVSQSELELIAAGGGLITNTPGDADTGRIDFSLSDLREAFVHRKLWGIYLGQFCLVSLFTFFLTWFPTYLVEFRGLDFIQSGFLASIPFLAAFVGVLLSGFVSDLLVRRGVSKEASRKGPIILGMLLSILIIGANYTDSTALIIFFLAIAFFGNGLASITWVFVSLLAPKRLIGLVGGVFNFVGGLGAVVSPTVIGFLAEGGSFESALFFVGSVAFGGLCSYVFLVGKIERVRETART
ncbi:ACS family D-galactonate transporter-like MFS transporter [Neolewinella xylanilytica]|uniref:ACS family D-galactonate transporter-like MFS transporter n=1 Tax=Neolewinella xylanilytica TaxID=1514080 RepID=A0A2S6I1S3_9BACT|nr:MFS transporter [Neolewinella xylanilytica]PPK85029.1 ACS family D-galactonate transporter-like MFS transporter [Neolewinella xylanilytica]